jgi:hypothetical protein
MSTEQIRTQIHQYVDQIDAEFLTTLKRILENRLSAENELYKLTDEDLAIIRQRKAAIASGEEQLIDANIAIELIRKKKTMR